MKSILIAIQPYWVFLIIAKIMGWGIDQEKTVEVRKNFPKDLNWNRKAIIYCSKNKQSFNRIPKKYQPLMEKFLGKVIGSFVCDRIDEYSYDQAFDESMGVYIDKYGYDITSYELGQTCLTYEDFENYGNTNRLFGWHITDLVIYDKPKELREFMPYCKGECTGCKYLEWIEWYQSDTCTRAPFKRPPQSWCYVEELGV